MSDVVKVGRVKKTVEEQLKEANKESLKIQEKKRKLQEQLKMEKMKKGMLALKELYALFKKDEEAAIPAEEFKEEVVKVFQKHIKGGYWDENQVTSS